MYVDFTVKGRVPSSFYCGDCCRIEKDATYSYCGLFYAQLNPAKDRPQFVKCKKCAEAVRQSLEEADHGTD